MEAIRRFMPFWIPPSSSPLPLKTHSCVHVWPGGKGAERKHSWPVTPSANNNLHAPSPGRAVWLEGKQTDRKWWASWGNEARCCLVALRSSRLAARATVYTTAACVMRKVWLQKHCKPELPSQLRPRPRIRNAFFFVARTKNISCTTVLSAATTTFICVYVWINDVNRLWQMCLKLNYAWKVNGKSVETLAQSIEWQKKDSGLDLQVSKINHGAKTALIHHPDGRKGINKFLRRT